MSRTMYWTKHRGAIVKGGMDGSNVAIIVSGLRRPGGIIYESGSSRLYWTDEDTLTIQSSDTEGRGLATIATLPSSPFGIALYADRFYWGSYGSSTVKTVSTSGADIKTVYTASGNIRGFAKPVWNPPTNRENHCERHSCSRVCVLTPGNSSRCLS